ncbi:PREDICTED: phosphoinositide phospholipase C 6-like isoform X4 [Ipomoea nil]|uniref:phosphoinositide phospholipase C 6-like isoform X4 n=1 Tax=Ipomoea nil TaxID=35883 RepID=UPI0009013B2B|nr:PREDICTED: phosphoinositide phospholipase C 6-like isoform X4 [Ipomoea nil]
MGSYNYYKMLGFFNRKFKISEREPPPDVRDAFSQYAVNGPHMNAEQLARFLVEYQGEEGRTADDAAEIIQKIHHRRQHLAKHNHLYLDLDGFFEYLFQDDLNGPLNTQVSNDMSAPLQHYFIYTGHNSYLTGNQLSSRCSEKPIIRALERGVRGIELDLWPNSAKDNIHVLHGRTLTTPVTLYKCLESIKNHAFVKSPYPVIITLEDHLTPELHSKAAEMLTEVLGEMLYYPESGCLEELPSPEELKHRILLSTKAPKEYLESRQQNEKEAPASPSGKESSEDESSVKETTENEGERINSGPGEECSEASTSQPGGTECPEAEKTNAEQRDCVEAEKTNAEQLDRVEAEKTNASEAEKTNASETEKTNAEQQDRVEAEKTNAEQLDRVKAEKTNASEAEKTNAEQQDRVEDEKTNAEQQDSVKAEKTNAEQLDRGEAEKTNASEAEKTNAEQQDRVEAEKTDASEAEKTNAEQQDRVEAEKTDAEQHDRGEAEKKTDAEQQDRGEAEKTDAETQDSERAKNDPGDEGGDASTQSALRSGGTEYKRLIAIRAGKAKQGVRQALTTAQEKVKRLSLNEGDLEKAAASFGTDVIRFTQKSILRVFPKGTRVTSSNFKPMLGWMHGAQMVAFNMQGYGKSLWLMHGMFRANGGCGYVKKPQFLIERGPEDEVFDPKVAVVPLKFTLKVTVYLGDGWRLDFSHTHFDAFSPPDFYTKLFIVGAPADCAKRKTRIIEDDWGPIWGEEFEFPLTVPEMALLRIEVREYDMSEKDDFGGQTCLPVSELRPGIRSVPLHDKKGEKLKSVRLLMRFQFI